MPKQSDQATSNPHQSSSSIYENIQSHYGQAASKTSDPQYSTTVASAFGYTKEDLTHAPADSNLGLSCGNPFAIANIREGETIIDLGSGAGFDVFQAAKKVGQTGRVLGVDQNKDMLTRANNIKLQMKADNVTFINSPITSIPLGPSTADCIISNCVINLVPEAEKPLVFREMFRLLKPGGRVAISDILLKKDLPEELRKDVSLYAGCIAGASRVEGYERYLRGAGFRDILIILDQSDLNIYKTANEKGEAIGCCGPVSTGCCGSGQNESSTKEEVKIKDLDLNEWAASFKIYAVKPGSNPQ
ncbi:hypothetical protein ACLMJK_007624 [Lecanora helva]